MSAPPRILISGGLAVGGIQTHVMLLCRVLSEAGAHVTIVAASTNWPRQALAEITALGVRVIVSPFGFGAMKIFGKLWSFLAWPVLLRRDYNVLYCVGEGRMHLWARRFVRPDAWQIYHEIAECPAPGSVAAEVSAKMHAVVANSREVGKKIARMLRGVTVRTVPFLTSDVPVPLATLRTSQSTLRIAFLGRLAPHKRPRELIDAWPAWNARAPIGPARLDFYGGDYDHQGPRLRTRIAELGLQDSVQLHGAYAARDLPRILGTTDLVVLPSLYEGLPLVLVEAMLRGIPVVATSAGGTAELGEDNPDVIITEGTEWHSFAAGVERMTARLREGEINSRRLQEWTEARYGFEPVAQLWRGVLLTPEAFFAKATPCLTTP